LKNSSDFSQIELAVLQLVLFPKSPSIPLNDPPNVPKNHCNLADFKWYLINPRIISGKFSPSSKRFLWVRERRRDGSEKVLSIRSEINSSPIPIDHNYLIINDISILIESTYKFMPSGGDCFKDFRLKYKKKAGPFDADLI
jgi:hypothetical protein